MLLVYDSLHSLWQDAILEGQILDLRALQIGTVDLLLDLGRKTTLVHHFSLLWVLEDLLFDLEVIVEASIVNMISLSHEIIHQVGSIKRLFLNRLLHEICLNAILVLIRLLSIRSVHVLVHFLDIVLELVKAGIIITLIGDFLNLILALFELFVVTIFIAISVDRTSDTAAES